MKGNDVWLRAVDQQIQGLKDKLPLLETFDAEDKANALSGRPTVSDKELNRLDRAINSEEKALLWVAHTSRAHPLVDESSRVSAGRNEANSEPIDLGDDEPVSPKPAKTPRPPFQSPRGPARPKRSSESPAAESASPLPPTSASS